MPKRTPPPHDPLPPPPPVPAWDRDFRTILDSINDGVFTVDAGFRVTFFNQAASDITGLPQSQALGRPCCEVFRADICEGECALKRTLTTGRPLVNQSIIILNSLGRRLPISLSTALLKDESDRVIGGVGTFRDLSLVEELRKEVEKRFAFHDILSANQRMREIFATLPQVAESECTVLIAGESGTGKELLARAIHELSPRREKPMITVNCGSLPDTLLESELFGYLAGAFTDARRDKPGRVSAAQGGTLFLDEVGDVTPAMQIRLLRLLQERTFEPLGSNRTQRANVRFISATHRNLLAEVAVGRFREDLFYRLKVVQINLPPLRERPEDIPLLARHFLDRLNRIHGRDVQGFSPDAMRCLIRHPWPGNIRELENALEHAFVLYRTGLIEPAHLPDSIRAANAGGRERRAGEGGQLLKDAQLDIVLEALRRHRGNQSAAARELGIHKTTLWRKLKLAGLKP